MAEKPTELEGEGKRLDESNAQTTHEEMERDDETQLPENTNSECGAEFTNFSTVQTAIENGKEPNMPVFKDPLVIVQPTEVTEASEVSASKMSPGKKSPLMPITGISSNNIQVAAHKLSPKNLGESQTNAMDKLRQSPNSALSKWKPARIAGKRRSEVDALSPEQIRRLQEEDEPEDESAATKRNISLPPTPKRSRFSGLINRRPDDEDNEMTSDRNPAVEKTASGARKDISLETLKENVPPLEDTKTGEQNANETETETEELHAFKDAASTDEIEKQD